MLAKSPGFTAAAVLSLALGIGANSAIFSLLDAMFLRPLPVTDPEQLVWVRHQALEGQGSSSAHADYLDIRDQTTAFSGLAAESRRLSMLKVNGEAELVPLTVVSDNYFAVLGVGTVLGRGLDPERDRLLERETAVLISHSLWQRDLEAVRTLLASRFSCMSVTTRWWGWWLHPSAG